ncbi:hypothetical protein ACPOL_5756 [Acidisarcina polymorpha]|uniref:Uncharacterized protein n=1 Tax=Acidisarcina polymorpha TaxID=2211140 RepID=A0A2Z5G6X9_9BACT|nr:hypothetical protein ACPOL_5756 [Acidisarcina polymorpha]
MCNSNPEERSNGIGFFSAGTKEKRPAIREILNRRPLVAFHGCLVSL